MEKMTYDKKGLLAKEETLSPTGELISSMTYSYNEKGFLKEDQGIISDVDEDGKRSYFTDRKYVYSYDESGNVIEELMYDLNDQLETRAISKYDSAGNCIEYSVYGIKNERRIKQTIVYDKKGNSIEWRDYNSKGELTKTKTTIYDADGNPIEETDFDHNKPTRRSKFVYEFIK